MIQPQVTTNKTLDILEQLPLWLLCLTPLVFYPYVFEPFELPKLLWIIFITTLGVVSQLGLAVARKKLELSFSFFSLGMLLLSLASLTSAIFSKNIIEAFLTPFGPWLWINLTVFSIFRPTQSAVTKSLTKLLLPLSFVVIAIISVASRLKILQQLFPSIPYVSNPYFTPSGIALTVMFLLIFSLTVLGIKAYQEYKNGAMMNAQLLIVAISLLIVGLISHGSFIAKDILSSRFGIRDNWTIAFNTISNPTYTLTGIGPQNYLSSFTQYRPVSMNQTAIWNTRASVAGGLFFHVLATLGLFGIGALGVVVLILLTQAKEPLRQAPAWLLLLSLFIVPPNLALIITLYLTLYLNESKHKILSITIPKWIVKFQFPLFGLLIGKVIIILWILGVLAINDQAVYQSNTYLSQQDATNAYQSAKQAASALPYLSLYQRNLSRIEAVTALSLLTDLNNQATNSANRTQMVEEISTLLQQAIKDSQAATALGPVNVENWEQLASIYGRIIGIADNAQRWAIESYQQVVRLDPTNPISRFRLASVYAYTGDYDQAIAHFLRAIELKADYADPYIGLAQVYAQRGEKDKTIAAIDTALTYLPEGEIKTQLLNERSIIATASATTNTRTPMAEPTPVNQPANPPLPLDLPTPPATSSAAPDESTNRQVTPEILQPTPTLSTNL